MMERILLTILFALTVGFGYGQTYNMSNASVTTCSGTFYDSQGTSSYLSSENYVKTFTPSTAGNMLKFVFNSFSVEGGTYDYLRIYDGPSTASPLIGTYTANPGTITSTNATGQLTFWWVSDGYYTYAGWDATISCIPSYNLTNGGNTTACTGLFYDPQGTSNYTDFSGSYTHTFCSGTGDAIRFNFTSFLTQEAADNLKIYDGPNASATLLGTYSQSSSPGVVTSSGTCLTFVWTTDGNHTNAGWAASISCIAPPSVGDNCTNAQNLTTLTSPYSGTTTAYINDISVCNTGAPDRIFYIDVPNCNTVDIWQSSNTYDSYHYMGYGSTCPGATSLYCTDTDLQHNTWTNTTGSTQTVWFVVDGYSSYSGDFVLNWTLASAAAIAAPTAATHTPSGTQIVWDWNNVTGATGYKWNTVNNYATATDLGAVSTVTQTGLTCGTSYTIYIWSYNTCGNSVSTTLNSTITCPATNDECVSATSLPCATTNLAGSTEGTVSNADPIVCGSNYGVWYTFVGDGLNATISSIATFDHEMVISSGSCGSLTNIACVDAVLSGSTETNTFTTVNGTTYFVYIAHYSTSSTTTGTFTISRSCAALCNPYTSVTLTANGNTSDFNFDAGTLMNLSITNSGTAICSGNIEYQFQYSTDAGTTWTTIQDWSTTATCSHTPTMDTRYRVRERCSACTATVVNDNINVTLNVVAPTNNLCANATMLPCATANLAGTTVGTIDIADPIVCASDYGVWYTFVGDGISTTISSNATFDHEMVISSGSCGSLTNVVCDDDASSGEIETYTFTPVNGTTYYVYIAHYSSSYTTTGTFTISRNCGGNANPDCNASEAFCTSTSYLFPATVDGIDYGAIGCLYTTPNPAWYYMEIDSPGDIVIDITSDWDVDFIAWGPFVSLPDACSLIDMVECSLCPDNIDDPSYYPSGNIVDCSYSIWETETATITGAQVGEIYVLLITNYENEVTDIAFSQTSGIGTTNCGIVAPPVSNNGPLCIGSTLQLTVEHPIVGATYSWTGPGGWTSSLENPTISNVTAANAGSYSLVITLGLYTSNTVTTTVVVQTPATTGLVNGDYVWSGLTDTDWLTSSNWLTYNGSAYSVALTAPLSTTNVFLRDYGTCAANIATIGASQTGNCENLTNETALIMGASSLINVYGNWTCTGTFTAGTGTALFNLAAAQTVSPGGNPFYNFTVTKTGGSVTALQDLECLGNFTTTNATSIFNSNGLYITVAGNFVNATGNTTYTNTGATGTLKFSGAAAQTYTQGSAQLDLNNVVMNNTSSGLTLLTDMFMKSTGVLTLTSGIIHTGSFKLHVLNTTATSVPVGSSISYINGNLRRYFAQNTNTYPFPVGVATAYRLAEIVNNNLVGITYFDSKFLTSFTSTGALNVLTAVDAGTPYTSIASEGIWQIDPSQAPTSGSYSINLWFNGGGSNAFTGLVNNSFGPVKRPTGSTLASAWTAIGGTLNAINTVGRTVAGGYARRNGWTTFSEFAIAKSSSPLPVELIQFSGQCIGNTTVLSWATQQEINNDYFTIERSNDGINYTAIGALQGQINSSEINTYSFIDDQYNAAVAQSRFYRLKQTDLNGEYTYSEPIVVHCTVMSEQNEIVIINVEGETNIQIKFPKNINKEYRISVTDNLGRSLYNKTFAVNEFENEFEISKSQFSIGMYHLIIYSDDEVCSKQIVISSH